MNREQIRLVLKTIFEEETSQNLESLDDDAVLAEDFALDSVDLVSLLMRVEGHFHLRLTNDELAQSRTVGALIDLVADKLVADKLVADKLVPGKLAADKVNEARGSATTWRAAA